MGASKGPWLARLHSLLAQHRRQNGFVILQSFYERHFTATGKALLLLFMLSTSLGLVGTDILLYILMLSLFGAGMAPLVVGAWNRPRHLQVSLPPLPPGQVGIRLGLKLILTNRQSRWLYHLQADLRLRTPSGQRIVVPTDLHIAGLAPSGEVTVHVTYTPPTRGLYTLASLDVYSTFPLAIYRWYASAPIEQGLRIHPQYRWLERLEIPLGQRYQPGGMAFSSNIGESLEFRGLRPFAEGDNPKQVHWPALARTQKLYVREQQEEYFVRLGILLDTAVVGNTTPALEAAISLAASVAAWMGRQEYILDVFAAGSEIYHFQAGRSLGHLERILDILATLQGQTTLDMPKLQAELESYLPQVSAFLCILLTWDTERAELIQRWQQALPLKVLIIHPHPEQLVLPAWGDVQVIRPEAWREVML